MKKLLLFFSAVIMLTVVSCGSADDCKDIYEKIQNGTELTQDDYAKMINYIEGPLTETSKILAENAQGGNIDFAKVEDKINKIGEKYPYIQPFTQCLINNSNLLDEKNLQKFSDIQQKMVNHLAQ